VRGHEVFLRQVVVLPIRAYRLVLSPLFPPACRFEPTCSKYSVEAVLGHGILRGGWLAMRRILRCHPWSDAGIDQVPTPHR
jgi:putative membrane protein insertion efficiency factor